MPRMSMIQIDVGFNLSASQWLTELQNLAIPRQKNNPIYYYRWAVSLIFVL